MLWPPTRCPGGCRRVGSEARSGRGRCRWFACRGHCRRSSLPARSTRWWGRRAPSGTGRWSWRWCWVGCAAAKCWACDWRTCGSVSGGCSSLRARAAINGSCRSPTGSSPPSGDYLHDERPRPSATDRVFVVLKEPRRGQPLSADGVDEILTGARRRAGLEAATCHQLRHTCLTRLREAGMALEAVQAQAGHRSIESTRIYLHLTNDWLAGEYRRASELIDVDTAELIALQEVTS